MKKQVKNYLSIAGLILLSVGCHRSIVNKLTNQNTTSDRQANDTATVDKAIKTPSVSKMQANSSGKPTQYVVMAFDGSYSLDMWQKTLDFAQEMKAQDSPVNFTYFLSGVYFLNWRKASRYLPPKKPAGTSDIGFADSNRDVERRVAFVNRAISEGHEIGSHANGHFDGSRWTEADWSQELRQFDSLILQLAKNNDVDPPDEQAYTINLSKKDLMGFRAPDLKTNGAMYQALNENGYVYDTSGVGKADNWPKKNAAGIWEFPVTQITYASSTSQILAMDYNFYFKQSKAIDVAKRGDEQWNNFLNQTYTSYINYFNKNYSGSRAPVYIGSHFSEWNDGVYWEAMKKFAQQACVKPEVKCVSFKELMEAMDSHPRGD